MLDVKTIQPMLIVDGFVGELAGLDLSAGSGAEMEALLTRAHQQFPVLVIRDQSLDTSAFMDFGKVFGTFEIDHHVPQFQDKNHPEVVYLTNRDSGGQPDPASAGRGAAWHADSTFKEYPCAHTVLYALKMPRRGAGTHFADMHRAYETLSPDIKKNHRRAASEAQVLRWAGGRWRYSDDRGTGRYAPACNPSHGPDASVERTQVAQYQSAACVRYRRYAAGRGGTVARRDFRARPEY
ncbi:MAG: hypothetical protein GKS00_15480 [Alphaproteobacteria bacterium]|nr:hypothetical protein [Alphaproteobacteria bacterium]